MSKKERELWAKAVVFAMLEEIPMYPMYISEEKALERLFYKYWLWGLGFDLWT